MSNNTALINYLKVLIGNDVEPNIVSYITSMKHVEDFEEFMENIVDKNNSAHKQSYAAIRDIIFGKKKSQPSNTGSNSEDVYNKKPNYSVQHKKDKKKFKDINSYQAKKKEKEGRSACDCMGQEHEFMNNCVHCGRIHCLEEGPGPCLFCGNMITVRGAELLQSDNKRAKAAMRPKENKVFDDDNDYFKMNSQKSSGKDSKQKMIVALDFATRRVIESTQEDMKIKQKLLENSIDHLKKVDKLYKNIQNQSEYHSKQAAGKHNKVNDDLINLLIQMRHRKPIEKEDLGVEDSVMPIIDYGTRVLDEDLIANTDHGLCLSMHQPYASLLVAGVKRHEGRSWPTTHRGRLWIAAASKQPEQDDIEAVEDFYRSYYKDPTLMFPKEYPTGCLLGCVYIDDCLDQETCKKTFPHGEENNSSYIFVCKNPIILPIFYPIAGKHKIYPLEKELHKCAKMALQHAKYII